MSDGDKEEGIAIVGNASQGVIPSRECSQKAEETTSFDDGWVRVAGGVPMEVSDSEQEESEI